MQYDVITDRFSANYFKEKKSKVIMTYGDRINE